MPALRHMESDIWHRRLTNKIEYDSIKHARSVSWSQISWSQVSIQDFDKGELVELGKFIDDPLTYKPLTEEQKAKRQRETARLGYIGLEEPKQSKRNRPRMSGQASSSNKPAPQ